MKRTIGVFGGAGFLGSAICDRLLLDGYRLKIFERPRIEAYRTFTVNEKVDWITGDFASRHDVADFLVGVDIVIHLISTTLPKKSNDDMIYDVQSNVVSTLQLLDVMVEKSIKKVIFISSGGTVYGKPIAVPILETHPTDPTVSYGITKLTIEKYLHLYHCLHQIKPVILRVANPYGERQRIENSQGAVGVFLNQAINDEPIEIWGDGTIVRDYIYITDVAEAFSKAIEYSGDKTTFNIGSGEGHSLNELIDSIQFNLGKKTLVNHKPARSFDVPVNVLDISKANQELNWAPTVKFEDGIRKTIAWMIENAQNEL